MWLLMCPKADKGASSGYRVASLFVIAICLLVVGTKEFEYISGVFLVHLGGFFSTVRGVF